MCIIDEDHMIYGSWNIRCSRQNFLLFWAMFCTFTPLKTWKIKIVTNNKKKNTRRYYHFTHVHHKWQSYDVWFLKYGAQQRIFCHLGSFFGLLHPYGPRKSKFSTKKNQKKKTSGDIIILHNVHHMVYGSCDMECNRQTFLLFWTIFYPFWKDKKTMEYHSYKFVP